MHAVTVSTNGGPQVLDFGTSAVPEPGAGQVQFAVAAAGINFIETYQRSGQYRLELPRILGAEGAGTVSAVGPGVTDLRVGDRIATAEAATGTYSEYAVVDADKALPVPEQLTLQQAAALPLQGMTAHYLSSSVYAATADTTALVHAGAGGVGLLLIQLLKAKGARVLSTVSSQAKAELASAAGADEVHIGYSDFSSWARDMTSGRGVDVVYDGVGKATFDGSLAAVAIRGTLAVFGAASGPVPPFDLQRLNAAGSVSLVRPSLGYYLRDSAERRWRSDEIFDAAVTGRLRIRISETFALSDARRAHEDLEGRRTTGKILLVP